MVSAVESAAAMGFVERDGNRCGRCIAVMVKIDKNLFIGNSKPIGNGIDDAEVGLVGNDAGDVLWLQSRTRDNRLGGIFHARDGVFEDFFA